MTDLFDKLQLIVYLKSLLCDINMLNDIKNKSYLHFNNFVKIPIFKTEKKIIRLHIWFLSKKYQNPHSHGWCFRSKIIKGKFVNTLFDENDEGNDKNNIYNKNIIHLRNKTKSTNIDYFKQVKLSENSTVTYKENDVYDINRNQIHTFFPTENNSITLIECETDHDDMAYVYSKSTLVEKGVLPNLTIEELKQHLVYVIEHLETINI